MVDVVEQSPAVLAQCFRRLTFHPEQRRLMTSPARFRIAACGRRSGKTLIAKVDGFLRGVECERPNGLIVFAAPTRDQAKDLYWQDLKAMAHPSILDGKPLEDELKIRLITGTELRVVGMDVPERVEGRPIDHIVMDEFANWKSTAWKLNVRPALSTKGRLGTAMIVGTPEGRNHFFDLCEKAKEHKAKYGAASVWDFFHWKSADILDASEIEAAREELDELSFAQEYEASFVTFQGLAYGAFDRNVHAAEPLLPAYNPYAPLIVALDFNISPGVACIGQMIPFYPDQPAYKPDVARTVLGWLGEVHIPRNSRTVNVCRKVIAEWAPRHHGPVVFYGDATGGQNRTTGERGSDWDVVKQETAGQFRGGVSFAGVPRTNPEERTRVNCMNSLLRSTSGRVGMLIDPSCRKTITDYESVTVLEGGSGELEKIPGGPHTHLTDAHGYVVFKEFPIRDNRVYFQPQD